MLSGYIPAVQTLGVNIQNAKNMHRTRSVVYFVVACLNVIASIFLIKKWGVIGTCVGTLFATLIGHGMFMNYYYHTKIGLNIISFWKEMSKWIFPVGILTFVSQFLTSNISINNWFVLLALCLIYSCVYVGLLYIIGLNHEQKLIIKNKVKSLL